MIRNIRQFLVYHRAPIELQHSTTDMLQTSSVLESLKWYSRGEDLIYSHPMAINLTLCQPTTCFGLRHLQALEVKRKIKLRVTLPSGQRLVALVTWRVIRMLRGHIPFNLHTLISFRPVTLYTTTSGHFMLHLRKNTGGPLMPMPSTAC